MSTMTTQSCNPNESWRNYYKRESLHSCKLSKEDLKKLHQIINERQIQIGTLAINSLEPLKDESSSNFEERKIRVQNAHITTIRITGSNNETITGHGETIFDSPLFPDRIVSIEYDTTFSPKAKLNYCPNSNIILFLDFYRPTIFGQTLPGEPTPNNSNWAISSDSEDWSTSLSARINDFFSERSTYINWLHRPSTYDLLLLLIGFPFSLWGTSRIGNIIFAKLVTAPIISSATYVYIFLLFLNIFRWTFSYSRWLFPKIDADCNKSASLTHKAIWCFIITTVLGSTITDLIKYIFTH